MQECVRLLEVARRRSLIDESKHQALRDDLETIAKMISGLWEVDPNKAVQLTSKKKLALASVFHSQKSIQIYSGVPQSFAAIDWIVETITPRRAYGSNSRT